MTSSSSSSSAESPASEMRTWLLAKCLEQLAVNPAEPAIRHQHDDVAVASLAGDRRDDVVDLGNVPGMASLTSKVEHQLVRRQSLGFGKRRSKHSREDDLVRRAERSGEIILEHTAA